MEEDTEADLVLKPPQNRFRRRILEDDEEDIKPSKEPIACDSRSNSLLDISAELDDIFGDEHTIDGSIRVKVKPVETPKKIASQ